MIALEFDVKFLAVYRYTYLLTGICLVLTFFDIVNQLNYAGASIIIATISLEKPETMQYGLVISCFGCLFDFVNLIFHSSDSDWYYIRCLAFVEKFFAFMFELTWLFLVYIYMVQEQILSDKKQKLKWIGNKLNEIASNIPDESLCSSEVTNKNAGILTEDHADDGADDTTKEPEKNA